MVKGMDEEFGGAEKVPLMEVPDKNDKASSRINSKTQNGVDCTNAPFWLFMLFVASIPKTVGETYVIKEWNYAITLTLMQNGMAVFYMCAHHHVGMLDIKPFEVEQWKVFAVSSFLLAMQILSSFKAMSFVTMATIVVFRNVCTIAIAILDNKFLGNKFNQMQMLSLAAMVYGMILYAMEDINFNLAGYLWLAGNSIATIVNTFWNKVYITYYTKEPKIQTTYGVSFIQQVETIPILLILAIANEEGNALRELMPLDAWFTGTLFVTCLGGILLCIAYPKCFSLVSGTGVVVASTANTAVSILIGTFMFGTQMSGLQVAGLLVCIAGSLWYAIEGMKGNKEERQLKQTTARRNDCQRAR